MIRLPILFLAALAMSCSPQPAAEAAPSAGAAAVHPVSGLPVIALTAEARGKRHRFRVEVARSDMEQARGLMFRTALGPDEGMLFLRAVPSPASFWMKNTPLPLDIIFIGTDRRVLNVAANTVPYSLDPVESEGSAAAVLEIPGGRAAELGIGPGARVSW